jgi:hypothetical protein
MQGREINLSKDKGVSIMVSTFSALRSCGVGLNWLKCTMHATSLQTVSATYSASQLSFFQVNFFFTFSFFTWYVPLTFHNKDIYIYI